MPFYVAWFRVKAFFKDNFVDFFTETIPDYFIVPFYVAWFRVKAFFKGNFVDFFTETIPGVFEKALGFVIDAFQDFFVTPFKTAWGSVKDFFKEDFTNFFTETIPGIFKLGWDSVIKLFVGFANILIRGMNTLIRAIGKLPIPTVRIGLAYKKIGPLSVPYPTFSVGTRPLSSFVNLPQIPLIPTTLGQSSPGLGTYDGGQAQNAPGGTARTIFNQYFLAENDFSNAVQKITNAPNAQARAVGAP